ALGELFQERLYFSLDLDDGFGLGQLLAERVVLGAQPGELGAARAAPSALVAAWGHDERSLAVLAPPVGDDRGIEALASQQRTLRAGLAAAVVLGEDRQLVVAAERAALRPVGSRAFRCPQILAAGAIGLSLPGPNWAQVCHVGDPPPPTALRGRMSK